MYSYVTVQRVFILKKRDLLALGDMCICVCEHVDMLHWVTVLLCFFPPIKGSNFRGKSDDSPGTS